VGELVTDRGDASGTGWWSPSDGRYRLDLLAIVDRELDWSDMLPRVLDPIEPAGSWRGAVVAPGTGDNMAAALGLGLGPGDVMISLGSSGTVATVSDTPTADPSGAVAGFADATGRFLPLVCTLNATKVTDAMARWLGVDTEGLSALALEARPGSSGLTLLPYLDGERTPDRPGATGSLTGMRTDTDRASLARAAHEGVVCGLLDGLAALAAHTRVDDGRIWLVGGGARSAAYRQVLADLSGRPVITSDLDEVVATGACVQAAATLAGTDPAAVHEAWGLRTQITEPAGSRGGASPEEIRGRYAEVRDGTA
jgi:xylulokinase